MRIVIIDDSEDERTLLAVMLQTAGYSDLVLFSDPEKAAEFLGLGDPDGPADPADLILLDRIMPNMDGLVLLKRIRAEKRLADIPVVMVTVMEEAESVEAALDSGAQDYISKPFRKIELLARVRAALRLKEAIDERKRHQAGLMKTAQELAETNRILERLSFRDGLTGIANRRYFCELLKTEWRRAERDMQPVSLLLVDIDHFKRYNDAYGDLHGDNCLVQVASQLDRALLRPSDVVARYGGEKFAAILPDTDSTGARYVAERMRKGIADLAFPHATAAGKQLTVSIGGGTATPTAETDPSIVIDLAEKALYQSKNAGRDRITFISESR